MLCTVPDHVGGGGNLCFILCTASEQAGGGADLYFILCNWTWITWVLPGIYTLYFVLRVM